MANTAEKVYISEARQQIMFQHANADGYITLAKKDSTTNQFTQRNYKAEELAEHLSEYMGENVYYSQNTFYKPQRRIENIRQLRSLYVDVDFYTQNLDINSILAKLETDYFGKSIPKPNAIIFSGRGLVLIWLIDPVPYQALPLWQAVQNYLINQLSNMGADQKCSDAARVFRLSGTINSKNGNLVKIQYLHQNTYSLREIQENYLPVLTPLTDRKKGKKVNKRLKVIRLFNIYSLYHSRLLDLVKLIELRNYAVDGYRETICFLYRYWQCCFLKDKEDALQYTLDLNNMFTNPLPEKEVIKATKSAETAYEARSNEKANKIARDKGYPGAGYNISNKKLIQWLDITADEMIQMRTIINGIEKRRRKNEKQTLKRREAGMIPRSEYLQQKQIKLDILDEALTDYPNASLNELVDITGISRSTIQRLKKELLG